MLRLMKILTVGATSGKAISPGAPWSAKYINTSSSGPLHDRERNYHSVYAHEAHASPNGTPKMLIHLGASTKPRMKRG
jgi:hypothetical protein